VGGEENEYLVFLLLRLSVNTSLLKPLHLFFNSSGIYRVGIPFCGKGCCANTFRIDHRGNQHIMFAYLHRVQAKCVKAHNHIHRSGMFLFTVVGQCCKINSSFCGCYFWPVK
jgi:hypothetical protein